MMRYLPSTENSIRLTNLGNSYKIPIVTAQLLGAVTTLNLVIS